MSIHLLYKGRYGNNLFQFYLARLLSVELKYKIFIQNPCTHFPCLGIEWDQSNLKEYVEPTEIVNDSNLQNIEDYNKIVSNKNSRKIILNGFFQKKSIYLPYKNQIIKWFNPQKYKVPKNNVVMHIRLDDIINSHCILPLEYYEKALSSLCFDSLTICTDTKGHPYVEHFISKYKATVFERWDASISIEKDTINFISSHDKIILSQGTFSFWGGFFSKASCVINALPKTGWNSPGDEAGVDLLLDCPNYKTISLN